MHSFTSHPDRRTGRAALEEFTPNQEPTELTLAGATEKSSTATTESQQVSPSFSQAYPAYRPSS